MARVPRVFCDATLASGAVAELPATAAHHVTRVLRLKPGGTLILFDDSGKEYRGELLDASRRSPKVRVLDAGTREPDPVLAIHLILGVSRGQRMDYALQKATELGVTEITPVITRRSVVRLQDDKREQRQAHWRHILIHACEQSGRCRLPVLHPPVDFSERPAIPGQAGVLLDPLSDQTLVDLDPPSGALALLVGPEGGLSEQERQAALDEGFTGVRLGPRILRTETAPLAAIAAVQVLWGDFR
jgi:16S rRNA (uracil1498-N3)-methyltransferase